MSANENNGSAAGAGFSTRKSFAADETRAALDDLLALSTNNAVRKGDFGVLGENFGPTRQSFACLWNKFQEEKAAGVSNPGVKPRRTAKVAKEATRPRTFHRGIAQHSAEAAHDTAIHSCSDRHAVLNLP